MNKFTAFVLLGIIATISSIGRITPAFGAFEELLQYGMDLTNVTVDENGQVQGFHTDYIHAKSAAAYNDVENVTGMIVLFTEK